MQGYRVDALCDVGGEEVDGCVLDRKVLGDIIGADEELGVVLLDALHPSFLDLMRAAWVRVMGVRA